MDLEYRKSSLFVIFVCVVCFITNLSQMPYLVESGINRFFSIPVWILLLIVCLINEHILQISKIKGFTILIISFLIYLFFSSFFQGVYFSSSIDICILMTYYILIVGTCVGRKIAHKDIEIICTAYILSALLVCINIFMKYVRGADISERAYIYRSKNSVSQILLIAMILIIFLKLKKDYSWSKIVFYAFSLFLLGWTMIGLKSRASLLGILIIAIVIIINGKLNHRLRIITIIIIALIAVLFIIKPNVYNSLVNNVIYAGRDVSNLNDLSSGRSNEWINFFHDFEENSFWGHSYDKRESVFLSSFLQHGLIGGMLISFMVFYPFRWFLKNVKKSDKYYLMLMSVSLISIENGFFEQQAPFGPGVKCFFLWFMIGIYSTLKDEVQEVTINE